MSDPLLAAEDRLIAAMAAAARGPRRNACFALWLVVRAAEGLLPPAPLSVRAHAARLDTLERRLSSLSLPPVVRRACQTAVRALREGGAAGVAATLQPLVGPAREAAGSEAGDAVAQAVREARGVGP